MNFFNSAYSDCVENLLNNMQKPEDEESLYAQRIYDTQTANAKCYAQVNSGHSNYLLSGLPQISSNVTNLFVKLVLFIFVLIGVYLLALRIFYPMTEISLNLSTFSASPLTPDFLEKLLNK